LEEVAADIRQNGDEALPVTCDVALLADLARVVERTVATYGAIDGLINNAGVNFWYEAPLWTRHFIDADLRDVHAFDAAALDGDGDGDAVGCSFSEKIVHWW
jgi:NAD(P)-dependent dehydrogenase (short-subunit alcohol dehydrogenase family)